MAAESIVLTSLLSVSAPAFQLEIIFRFGETDSILQQRLGAMLMCIFSEAQSVAIDRHLHRILPTLHANLKAAVDDPELGIYFEIFTIN